MEPQVWLVVLIVILLVVFLCGSQGPTEKFLPEPQRLCQKICIGILKDCHKPGCECLCDYGRCIRVGCGLG